MSHKLEDLGRRPINFANRSVKDVLPEYFAAEYPDLVTFLEKYYDFLDSDGAHAFDTEIKQLYNTRDITETPTEYLDQVIAELGAGLQNGDHRQPDMDGGESKFWDEDKWSQWPNGQRQYRKVLLR